ncbi:hypothetical protein BT93_L5169 [Corymbia citriodora subsp. variegata]|uniref:PRA1 family protein n=1 Tax=Corymbia citriodora subsp. variegata TaxID=360336 RepID=A0A8T0CSI7_CORYI|nr:hypothetical protein BT93_L5169 [Corymbia citriodora subsp. variegata]
MSSSSPFADTTATSRLMPRAGQSFFATRRPWPQFFSLPSLSRPDSLGEAGVRIGRNLDYFRVNYAMIALGILFLSLLWHPISMIVFIVVFVAWFYLYFFRDEPLVLLGRTVDDRLVLGFLGVVTVVALILTSVWLNVLVSLLIGAAVVALHATFRGTEDLYNDDQDAGDGGLRSFVGSPTRAGYTSI